MKQIPQEEPLCDKARLKMKIQGQCRKTKPESPSATNNQATEAHLDLHRLKPPGVLFGHFFFESPPPCALGL